MAKQKVEVEGEKRWNDNRLARNGKKEQEERDKYLVEGMEKRKFMERWVKRIYQRGRRKMR